MSYQVIITEAAQQDVLDALAYLSQISPVIEDGFVQELYQFIEHLEGEPSLFRVIEGDYRRAHMMRYHYHIIFFIDDLHHVVRIVSILHERRHPRRWLR